MLGICGTSLSRYFHTVTHYSASVQQNQPLFLNFFEIPERISLHSATRQMMRPSDGSPPVKSRIFAQRESCGKNHDGRKSGKSGESRHIVLCELKMNIHNPHSLWKTPVDKPVENVENSEFSTGIPLF